MKVEIVTGLDRATIVNLVDGRNTSNQVKEVSLENLRDSFKGLRKVLDAQPYGDKIAYSEYETTTDGRGNTVAKPVSVMEVLKCLVCLDIKSFDDSRHPAEIATRNNKVIEPFPEVGGAPSTALPAAAVNPPPLGHDRPELRRHVQRWRR